MKLSWKRTDYNYPELAQLEKSDSETELESIRTIRIRTGIVTIRTICLSDFETGLESNRLLSGTGLEILSQLEKSDFETGLETHRSELSLSRTDRTNRF